MLKAKEAGKVERERFVREAGYPAYVTSAGWMGEFSQNFHSGELYSPHETGYSDDKVARLTKEALQQGFNHFKVPISLPSFSTYPHECRIR